MPRFKLVTDETLLHVAQNPSQYSNDMVAAAMEILEYRRQYGLLGVEFLESDDFKNWLSVQAITVPETDDDVTG